MYTLRLSHPNPEISDFTKTLSSIEKQSYYRVCTANEDTPAREDGLFQRSNE